jgi:hypothetical protein
MVRVFCLFWLLSSPSLVYAHGGALDSQGCHHDRKHGGYHCHRAAGSASAPKASALFATPAPPSARAGASYANCSEARAAGAAPVRAGDPGYSRKLDRDGDGVGCE